MTITETMLPPWLYWTMSLLQLVALAVAVRWAPWSSLRRVPTRMHLLFGAVVCLLLLWQISGRITPPLTMHLLGMTTVTLLLGPALAILAGTLACLGLVLLQQIPLELLLANAALGSTMPALVTAGVLKLLLRYGPRNLFVYMLGAGFAGGAMSMLVTLLSVLVLLALSGEVQVLRDWVWPVLLLAMFPEGFINGALVSGLTVYVPHWMRTFDDRHFLG